jgi:phytoene dehydrogenase-like protein
LDELGVPAVGGQPPLTGYALADDRLHAMPRGPAALLDSPLFGAGPSGAAGALTELLAAERATLEHVSLARWLDTRSLDRRSRQFVCAVVRLASYINAPDLLSAAAAQAQVAESADGLRYVDGGWQTIVDQLMQLAARHGVDIRRRAPADAVIHDARRVRGVRLSDGETLGASNVVLAVNPAAARALLGPAGRHIRPTIPVRAAVLDLALARLPNPEGGFILSLDRPLYLSVHSLAARLGPADGAIVHVARYIHPGDPTPAAQMRAELEWLMDLVQPGWRTLLVYQRFLPAMTVTHALPTATDTGLRGRPAVAIADLPGVFLAGDWVGEEHQLTGAALASAKQAALLALRQETSLQSAVGG